MRLTPALKVGISGEVGVDRARNGQQRIWHVAACPLNNRKRRQAHVRMALPSHQALVQTMHVSAALNDTQRHAAVTLQLAQQQIDPAHVAFDYQCDPADAGRVMVVMAHQHDLDDRLASFTEKAQGGARVELDRHALLRYVQCQSFDPDALLLGRQGEGYSLYTPAMWPYGLTVQRYSNEQLDSLFDTKTRALYLFGDVPIGVPSSLTVYQHARTLDEAIAIGLVMAS